MILLVAVALVFAFVFVFLSSMKVITINVCFMHVFSPIHTLAERGLPTSEGEALTEKATSTWHLFS